MKVLKLALVAALAALMAACSTVAGSVGRETPPSPIEIAKAGDLETQFFAVYGTYVIGLETAAAIAELPSTPLSVAKATRDAAAKVVPVAHAAKEALTTYTTVRREYEVAKESGLGTSISLLTALLTAQEDLEQAVAALAAATATVKAASVG